MYMKLQSNISVIKWTVITHGTDRTYVIMEGIIMVPCYFSDTV